MNPKRWLLLVGLVIVAVVMAVVVRVDLLPALRERPVKQTLRAATRATIVPESAMVQAPEPATTYTVTDREAVQLLARILLKQTRRSDARGDKCFEGWEEHHREEYWPRVVFEAPGGKRETIWLPLGDCQVWPDGLPWGWSWSGSTFADAVMQLTDLYFCLPDGGDGSVLDRLSRQGWDGMQLIEFSPALWERALSAPSGGNWHPGIVVGDFNGDGSHDLAALVRKGDRVRLIAAHCAGDQCWLFELAEVPYRDGLQNGRAGYGNSIQVRRPGTLGYRPEDDSAGRRKLALRHDGIEYLQPGKATVLYYWTGRKYERVVTGD